MSIRIEKLYRNARMDELAMKARESSGIEKNCALRELEQLITPIVAARAIKYAKIDTSWGLEDLIQVCVADIFMSLDAFCEPPFARLVNHITNCRLRDILRSVLGRRGDRPHRISMIDPDVRDALTRIDNPLIELIIKEEKDRRGGRSTHKETVRLDSLAFLRSLYYDDKLRGKITPANCLKKQQLLIKTAAKPKNPDFLRPVIRVDTNKRYPTVHEAVADSKNGAKRSIANAAHFGYTCDGSKWKWADKVA